MENSTNNSTNMLGGMGVAGILFIILIAAIVWGVFYKEKRDDQRALTAELCNTRTQLGLQAGAIKANRDFLAYEIPRLDELYNDYSYTRGKFATGISRNTYDIDRLDAAVFTSRCHQACPTSCGTNRRGRGEFTETTKYIQDGTSEITVRNACGNEFTA